MPRFFSPTPLACGQAMLLSAGAARHVQVLRMQPGQAITLFGGGLFGHAMPGENGVGGLEFEATILRMGRSEVEVQVGQGTQVDRESARPIHLAVAMPANERMDWLVEKATELGAASLQPLMSERSVLRLAGDRAVKKQAHWQAIAIAACEQCGRNRVPWLRTVLTLAQWLKTLPDLQSPSEAAQAGQAGLAKQRFILSLQNGTRPLADYAPSQSPAHNPLWFLCGPEGGFASTEEALAQTSGFAPVSLGPRVLRTETAALAALTLIA